MRENLYIQRQNDIVFFRVNIWAMGTALGNIYEVQVNNEFLQICKYVW